jgi:hypothetical protein
MEKELKISELAAIWSTSVPTTWNRVRKEGLTTFKKKDNNNKEINYVSISEDLIKKYINNVVNNVKNDDNNVYYEDMLNVNNVNNSKEDYTTLQEQGFTSDDIKEIINTITTVNKDYNERLSTLTDRLITAESKTLLLEDAKGREGYHINEINELKKENNRYKLYINLLITLLIILLLLITGFITYNIAVNKGKESTPEKSSVVQEQAITPPAKVVKKK